MNEEIKKTTTIVLSDEEIEKVSGGTESKIHYAYIVCPHCNKGRYYEEKSPVMGIFCSVCNGFFHWERP